MFRLLSKNREKPNTRIWGKCSKSCLHSSPIESVDLIATHYAFGYSPQKHYIVSVNVVCPVHGPEVWTIEKLFDAGYNFRENLAQGIRDGTICISCSTYVKNKEVVRSHEFSSDVTIGQAQDAITASRSYDFFIRNCKYFAKDTFRDFQELDFDIQEEIDSGKYCRHRILYI